VDLASKLKISNRTELTAIAFYLVTGIVFLVLFPFTNFAPHLILLGVLGIVTGASLIVKKVWTNWVVFIEFVVASTFALVTIFSIGFSNGLVTLGLIAYVVFIWIFTAYLALRSRPDV
jgi:uncharacterized membrane protein HdeD (DUF308 family)